MLLSIRVISPGVAPGTKFSGTPGTVSRRSPVRASSTTVHCRSPQAVLVAAKLADVSHPPVMAR